MASPTVSRPKRPCSIGPLDLDARLVEPRGEDGRADHARLVARFDDLVAAAERDFQRLLDDHVLAGPGGGHGGLQVRPAGRADRDHVDRRIGQHGFQVVVGLAAGGLGQLVGRRRNRVVAGHELRPANVADRPGVKIGDHSAADNAKTDRHDVVLR